MVFQIPLVVWRQGKRLVVLSGSNRLRVARELRLEAVPVIVRDFADRNAAKMFAVSDNLARRQLSTGQRAYLAYRYQQLLKVGAGRPSKEEISSTLTKIDARRSAAGKAGVSEGSVSAMKSIVESGDEELLGSIVRGRITVHEAGSRHVPRHPSAGRFSVPSATGSSAESEPPSARGPDCRPEGIRTPFC